MQFEVCLSMDNYLLLRILFYQSGQILGENMFHNMALCTPAAGNSSVVLYPCTSWHGHRIRSLQWTQSIHG